MTNLSDDDRRALNVLAHHSDGCNEARLLADGFTIRLLAGLVPPSGSYDSALLEGAMVV